MNHPRRSSPPLDGQSAAMPAFAGAFSGPGVSYSGVMCSLHDANYIFFPKIGFENV